LLKRGHVVAQGAVATTLTTTALAQLYELSPEEIRQHLAHAIP